MLESNDMATLAIFVMMRLISLADGTRAFRRPRLVLTVALDSFRSVWLQRFAIAR
jgi:hypothetical protein